jgi:short-subunit dehydrogenase
MDVRGTRALVTGASSGIGAVMAEMLAAEGVVVAVAGRREDALVAVAERIAARGASRPAVLPADLAIPGVVAELAVRAEKTLGRIDILINSAGAFETGTAASSGVPARALFETNYWAPMALAQTFLPGMRARGCGAIVNVSSIATVTPLPLLGSYPASKAALAAATEALRLELRSAGVHLVLAFLGGVDTPMHAKASRSYGDALRWMPLGRPEVAARRIVNAIRRERATVVYPRAVATMRWFPAISAWVSRQFILPLALRRREQAG